MFYCIVDIWFGFKRGYTEHACV